MKRLIVLATGLLAALAVSAAPAGAGATAAASNSICVETSKFSSLSALTTSSTAKGWNRDAPARVSVGDSNYDSGLAPNVPAGFKVTIPTYIHVITDGKLGRVTDAQIRQQMDVLNLSFAGFYGGANTGVSFKLQASPAPTMRPGSR